MQYLPFLRITPLEPPQIKTLMQVWHVTERFVIIFIFKKGKYKLFHMGNSSLTGVLVAVFQIFQCRLGSCLQSCFQGVFLAPSLTGTHFQMSVSAADRLASCGTDLKDFLCDVQLLHAVAGVLISAWIPAAPSEVLPSATHYYR